MIQLRQVEKCYEAGSERLYVLRRIDLDIAEGDFVTIMGPSGAGKTTLLSVLGMLDANWTGEYRFLDQDVHRLSPKQRAVLSRNHIGFVFQRYHLLDDLTVSENLDLPLSYQNVPIDRRRSMVCDVLDRFQIVAKKDLYPSQLSGGQQQLVGIARAIITAPTLLLADEPTGNLHSAQAEETMRLFKRLNDEGTTIVQVTHSERNATFGRQIVHLADGWITERPNVQAV
jgi:putative ABC transport system ATP-binding protein